MMSQRPHRSESFNRRTPPPPPVLPSGSPPPRYEDISQDSVSFPSTRNRTTSHDNQSQVFRSVSQGTPPPRSNPPPLPMIPKPPVPRRRESLDPEPLRSGNSTPDGASANASGFNLSSITLPGPLNRSTGTTPLSMPSPKSSSLQSPFESLSLQSVPSIPFPEQVLEEITSNFVFEAANHYKESFKTLFEFLKSSQLCDVEIRVGLKSFKCHKLVLGCVSNYFKTMFMSEMAESRQRVVTIKDIDEKAFESLLNFAYTARITLTTENVQPILFASCILQMESVAHACIDFMKTHLHPTNCIGVRQFAEQHNRTELMKIADNFILEHFIDVVDGDEFLTMSPKLIEKIIASLDVNVESEIQIYEAVIKWVKHDVSNRKQHLAGLISHVKLPLIPATYLMEKVVKEELLRRDLDCRDYIDEAKYYQLSLAGVVPGVQYTEKLQPRKSCAGVMFCVGGRGSTGDPFKSIECYDLRRNRWFQITEMTTKRRHVGVVSVNGKLYSIGGHDGSDHLNSAEVFDPITNKWEALAPMLSYRRGIAVCSLGGPIYAVGGLDDQTCFNTVERYDIHSNTWSHVSSMNIPRGGVGVGSLNGKLYAIGGNDGTSSLDSCERYDPHTDRWTLIRPMNHRRAGAGVAVMHGKLYVVGGFDDNSPLDSVECYSHENDTWTVVSNMSCPRGGVGVAALGGRIYAVGGHDGSNYLNSVEAYCPLSGSWSAVTGTNTCRAGAGVTVATLLLRDLEKIVKTNVCVAAGTL